MRLQQLLEEETFLAHWRGRNKVLKLSKPQFPTMPAGSSWGRYLSFQASALFSAVLGAQLVHYIYRPLDDLPQLVEEAKAARAEGRAGFDTEQKAEGAETEAAKDVPAKEAGQAADKAQDKQPKPQTKTTAPPVEDKSSQTAAAAAAGASESKVAEEKSAAAK